MAADPLSDALAHARSAAAAEGRAPRVLMVCLGNICRSPTAEAALRHVAGDAGVDVVVASCGTAAYHVGKGADPRTIRHGRSAGLDLSRHRARQLRFDDYADFDVLLAMDDDNLENLRRRAPPHAVHKLALFLGDAEVPDPWAGDAADFDHVVALCVAGAGAICAAL